MDTQPTLRDDVLVLQRQQRETRVEIAILHERQRRLRGWIARNVISPTSGPTAQMSHTSTATTAASPTTADALIPSSRASWLQLAKEHLPKIVGWVLERYLLPMLVSFALTGWAIVRRHGEEILAWIAGWWQWLAMHLV